MSTIPREFNRTPSGTGSLDSSESHRSEDFAAARILPVTGR